MLIRLFSKGLSIVPWGLKDIIIPCGQQGTHFGASMGITMTVQMMPKVRTLAGSSNQASLARRAIRRPVFNPAI